MIKVIFFILLLVSILSAALYLPPAARLKNSILSAIVDKKKSMKAIQGRKIILLGGSNLSFGLNSEKISEYFKMPVMNMGIHAGIGLKFTINNAKTEIRAGDIIVLVPEYENFYSESFNGEIELVSALIDICPENKCCLDEKQWLSLSRFIPVYAARKLKSFATGLIVPEEDFRTEDIYSRSCFNTWGDATRHWNLPDRDFASHPVMHKLEMKRDVFGFINEFKEFVALKQAKLILMPPVIEANSFNNLSPAIKEIEKELNSIALPFFSAPQVYAYPRSYFFNSYYHLNKKGVDIRTAQLINDLKMAMDD